MESFIVHVDMDAFFASVEQRDNPDFLNKPVIVGADPKKNRGVVSACSYEARKYGIHSAMPIAKAYKLCPEGIFIRPNMEKYENVSEQIYQVLYSFSPFIEEAGIDEAFLDISSSYHLFGSPEKTCLMIKQKIKKTVNLPLSVGLSFAKTMAKIASELAKPDGFRVINKTDAKEALATLTVDKLWGIGKKTAICLNRQGIYKVSDLAKSDLVRLKNLLGSSAVFFWNIAQGIDDSKINLGQDLKSISNELTFDSDINDKNILVKHIMDLSEKLSSRLRRKHLKARRVSIKIRFNDFETLVRDKTIKDYISYSDDIYRVALDLLNPFFDNKRLVRLLGIKLSSLEQEDNTRLLFSEKNQEKKDRIYQALDKIRVKFGEEKILRGLSNKLVKKR